jgi:hypothetical protein
VKLELASATKPLVEKSGRIDARRIHRTILPVVIEERGAHGQPVEQVANEENGLQPPAQVDPYLLHPYLSLVNCIKVPFNEQLDQKLTARGKYKGDAKTLSRERRQSIRAYWREQYQARKRLLTAIRDADRLRGRFHPVRALLSSLFSGTLQRCLLAGLVMVSTLILLGLPPGSRLNPFSSLWSQASISIDVAASSAGSRGSGFRGLPVDLSQGPVDVCLRVKMSNGSTKETWLHLIAEPPVNRSTDLVSARPTHEPIAILPEAPLDQPTKLAAKQPSSQGADSAPKSAVRKPTLLNVERVDVLQARDSVDEFHVSHEEPVVLQVSAVDGDGEITERYVRLEIDAPDIPDPEIPEPFVIESIEVGGIVYKNDKLAFDAGFTTVNETRSWQEVTELGLTDKVGLFIRATASNGESLSRVLRFSPKPLPTVQYRTLPHADWTPVEPQTATQLEPGVSELQVQTRSDAASAAARFIIPPPSVPTIEIRDREDASWEASDPGSQRYLREEESTIYIRATADGREKTAHLRLFVPTNEPVELEPPTIRISSRDLRTGRPLMPRMADNGIGEFRFLEAMELTTQATANGKSTVKSVRLIGLPAPPRILAPPKMSVRAVDSGNGRLTVLVSHSTATKRLVNGVDARAVNGFRPTPDGFSFSFAVPKKPQPVEVTLFSPDNINSTAIVLPVIVRFPGLLPQQPPIAPPPF